MGPDLRCVPGLRKPDVHGTVGAEVFTEQQDAETQGPSNIAILLGFVQTLYS